ncbi:MAG TPA: hypothetical protein VEL51_23825 [Vicinamibacterales bacterium]|nr:hypothetical protein [Vicinamibacterales bacterium]
MKLLVLPLMLTLAISVSDDKPKKPKVSVKANPSMGMSPARVVASADINGGPDDFEDFYCATVEWDWGDDTRSNNSADCDPYEAGKSQIKRRFSADHVYRTAGDYRIQFRLKKKDRPIAAASTSVKIRPGLGDPGGDSSRH